MGGNCHNFVQRQFGGKFRLKSGIRFLVKGNLKIYNKEFGSKKGVVCLGMSSTQLSHFWISKEPDELCDRPHKGFGKGYCGAAQVFNFLLFLGQMSASTE